MMAKLKSFINKILSINFEFKKIMLACQVIGCFYIPFLVLNGELPVVFYVAWVIFTIIFILQQSYLFGMPLKTRIKNNEAILFF